MQTIILVRHRETAKNIREVLHQADDPESLNDKGKSQLKITGQYLLVNYKPDVIFTSKEKRSIESGEIIAKIFGISPQAVKGFEERNWGNLSGKPWPEIKKVLDPLSLEDRYLYKPPRGESWKKFETRLINTLEKITSFALQVSGNR